VGEAAIDGARYRLLVAEDDGEMRRLVAGELRRDGYHVDEAASGRELRELVVTALVRANTAQPATALPHLIVSDVRMPGWTGLDLLEHLRDRGSDLPVVLITAFGDRDMHERAARLGAVAVLDKPFDCDELRRVVFRTLLSFYRERVG